ncbi:hypothetical protein CAOG_00561 [Capsaspora owczarzaki ATCC 30864]|uniref:RCC1-like domain-containing protein n=1 Tax=Capsaspora owczarzaki (strain ATCC 30864) TaxID=595528 RepID=A0A0D2X0G1_CAPO3|nr:hypothetical protein CAOG_00561 [Capsaspora owczarzaki ATCC 30864]KJE88999.1 hypothetical protein CAOG_000561 [Capsaspora owczarzaki ATCC 30864]|eukprot:XP_004365432.1 hypothetical protein CAOG_00561 [Capsaspora owczarzaki ATCC 30864]
MTDAQWSQGAQAPSRYPLFELAAIVGVASASSSSSSSSSSSVGLGSGSPASWHPHTQQSSQQKQPGLGSQAPGSAGVTGPGSKQHPPSAATTTATATTASASGSLASSFASSLFRPAAKTAVTTDTSSASAAGSDPANAGPGASASSLAASLASHVAVRLAATVTTTKHTLVAFVCSTLSNQDTLVVRYVRTGNHPLVRHIPWTKDPNKRILALDISPTAESVVCVSYDVSVHLIPVVALLREESRQKQSEQQQSPANMPAFGTDAWDDIDLDPDTEWSSLAAFGSDDTFSDTVVAPISLLKANETVLASFGVFGPATTSSPVTSSDKRTGIVSTSCATKTARLGVVSCCLWWKTFNGDDICVIGTKRGSIYFVNLNTQVEQAAERIKKPIERLELVDSVLGLPARYLLIHAIQAPVPTGSALTAATPPASYSIASRECFKLLLEQLVQTPVEAPVGADMRLSAALSNVFAPSTAAGSHGTAAVDGASHISTTAETILTNFGQPDFTHFSLRTTAHWEVVGVQNTRQGSLIGVHSGATGQYDVFDNDMKKYSLFVYQLFPDACQILLTDKFIFAVVRPRPPESHTQRLIVFSRILATATASNIGNSSNLARARAAVVQEFSIPADETVLHLARDSPIPSLSSGQKQREALLASGTHPLSTTEHEEATESRLHQLSLDLGLLPQNGNLTQASYSGRATPAGFYDHGLDVSGMTIQASDFGYSGVVGLQRQMEEEDNQSHNNLLLLSMSVSTRQLNGGSNSSFSPAGFASSETASVNASEHEDPAVAAMLADALAGGSHGLLRHDNGVNSPVPPSAVAGHLSHPRNPEFLGTFSSQPVDDDFARPRVHEDLTTGLQMDEVGMSSFQRRVQQQAQEALANLRTTTLDGCFVVTTGRVYHCRPRVPPEHIFLGLVAQQVDAEPFGKTVELDMHGLYELAADQYFAQLDYLQAFQLYQLSNVPFNKLLCRFAWVGQMDLVYDFLQRVLSDPSSLTANKRKHLSDLQFACFVQQLLATKAAGALERHAEVSEQFSKYITDNWDYDPGAALLVLISHGMLSHFLQVAETKGLMTRALNILVNRCALHLDEKAQAFLDSHGHADAMIASSDGVLLRCLPIDVQVHVLLSRPHLLLPVLGEQSTGANAGATSTGHGGSGGGGGLDGVGAASSRSSQSASVSALLSPPSALIAASSSLPQLFRGTFSCSSSDLLAWLLPQVLDPDTLIEAALFFDPSRGNFRSLLLLARQHAAAVSAAAAAAAASSTALAFSTSTFLATPRQSLLSGRQSTASVATVITKSRSESFHDPTAVPDTKPTVIMEYVELFLLAMLSLDALRKRQNQSAATRDASRFSADRWTASQSGEQQQQQQQSLAQHKTFRPWRRAASSATITALSSASRRQRRISSSLGPVAQSPPPFDRLNSSGIYDVVDDFAVQTNSVFPMLATTLETMGVSVAAHFAFHIDSLSSRLQSRAPALLPPITSPYVIACGSTHASFVYDGDVYTWGSSHNGQLGHGDMIDGVGSLPPARCETLHMNSNRIASISCGAEHTVAITNEGMVYAWGANGYGQLGLGDTDKRTKPTMLSRLEPVVMHESRIIQVACGYFHTLFLTDKGEVWACGWGAQGQLGVGSTSNALLPVHVKILDNKGIVGLAAGFCHSVVLTESGTLYAFGGNSYGQLGAAGTVLTSLTPFPVAGLADVHVTWISCGTFQTACVGTPRTTVASLETSETAATAAKTSASSTPAAAPRASSSSTVVYTWGKDALATSNMTPLQQYYKSRLKNMQQSPSDQFPCRFAPEQIEVPIVSQGVSHPSRGTSAASAQSTAAFGNRMAGSAFATVSGGIPAALAAADEHVVQVVCGDWHMLMLTSRGSVYCLGANEHGQLGINSLRPRQEIPKRIGAFDHVPPIIALAAGEDFSACVDAAGQTWIWGRADNGQLGQESTPNASASSGATTATPAAKSGMEAAVAEAAIPRSFTPERLFGLPPSLQSGYHRSGGMLSASSVASFSNTAKTAPGTRSDFGSLTTPALRLAAMDSDILATSVSYPAAGAPDVEDENLLFTEDERRLLSYRTNAALPDFLSLTVPYNHECLLACLRLLHPSYRTTHMLQLCMDWAMYEAAAVIYETVCDWPSAFECRLRHIEEVAFEEASATIPPAQVVDLEAWSVACFERYCSLTVLSGKDLSEAIASLSEAQQGSDDAQLNQLRQFFVPKTQISNHTLSATDSFDITSVSLIIHMLVFWKRHALPLASLEGVFRRHISLVASPLVILFIRLSAFDALRPPAANSAAANAAAAGGLQENGASLAETGNQTSSDVIAAVRRAHQGFSAHFHVALAHAVVAKLAVASDRLAENVRTVTLRGVGSSSDASGQQQAPHADLSTLQRMLRANPATEHGRDGRPADTERGDKQAKGSAHIPQERLWAEIRRNLSKDVKHRLKVEISSQALFNLEQALGSDAAPRSRTGTIDEKGFSTASGSGVTTLSSAGATSLASNGINAPTDRDVVVFTCDHCFSRRNLNDTVLPELEKRLTALASFGKGSITARLILADYRLGLVSLACPMCLFNALRMEVVNSSSSMANIPSVWVLSLY